MKVNLSNVMKLFLGLMSVAPAMALAKTCPLAISGNDQMQFSVKELTIPADCTEVTLTLKHEGKLPKTAMGHNWILTKAADMQTVATAGIVAGAANDFLPQADARIIVATKLIGGGETTAVTFPVSKLKAGEAYKFFCSFPGHFAIMNGTLNLAGATKS